MTSGEQIRQLRQRIPIGITEGLMLLKKHEGDFNRIISEFTGNDLQKIIAATNCTESTAEQFYFANRRDVPKAITDIIEEAYDNSYVPSAHITLKEINLLYDWFLMENNEGLDAAIEFEHEQVIRIVKHISELGFLGILIEKLRQKKIEIFSETEPDENKYIDLVNSLKCDPLYKQCEQEIADQMHIIQKVLLRHWRNLAPRID